MNKDDEQKEETKCKNSFHFNLEKTFSKGTEQETFYISKN